MSKSGKGWIYCPVSEVPCNVYHHLTVGFFPEGCFICRGSGFAIIEHSNLSFAFKIFGTLLNRIDRTLTSQIDVGMMAVKGFSTLSRSPELQPHNQIQFSVIPRTPLSGFLPLNKRYSQNILSPTDWTTPALNPSSVKFQHHGTESTRSILVFFYECLYVQLILIVKKIYSSGEEIRTKAKKKSDGFAMDYQSLVIKNYLTAWKNWHWHWII